jgi:hypothetical protein
MSIIFYVSLFFVYNAKASTSIALVRKSISTTSAPIVFQIPPPPLFLETTSVYSNQWEDEILQTKHKSLIAMILPIRMKAKYSIFNINQLPLVSLISSIDSS